MPAGDHTGRVVEADHRRDPVLAGHDRAVGHEPANLHDQRGRVDEQRRPAGISEGRDQDLAGVHDLRAGIHDHPRDAFYDPSRGADPRKGARRELGGAGGPGDLAFARHHPRRPELVIAGVFLAPGRNQVLHGRARDRSLDVVVVEPPDVVDLGQAPGADELCRDALERAADHEQPAHEHKLGVFADRQARAHAWDQPPDQPASSKARVFDQALRGLLCALLRGPLLGAMTTNAGLAQHARE